MYYSPNRQATSSKAEDYRNRLLGPEELFRAWPRGAKERVQSIPSKSKVSHLKTNSSKPPARATYMNTYNSNASQSVPSAGSEMQEKSFQSFSSISKNPMSGAYRGKHLRLSYNPFIDNVNESWQPSSQWNAPSYASDKDLLYQKLNMPDSSTLPFSPPGKQFLQKDSELAPKQESKSSFRYNGRAKSYSPARRSEFPYSSEQVKQFPRRNFPGFAENSTESCSHGRTDSFQRASSLSPVGRSAHSDSFEKMSSFKKKKLTRSERQVVFSYDFSNQQWHQRAVSSAFPARSAKPWPWSYKPNKLSQRKNSSDCKQESEVTLNVNERESSQRAHSCSPVKRTPSPFNYDEHRSLKSENSLASMRRSASPTSGGKPPSFQKAQSLSPVRRFPFIGDSRKKISSTKNKFVVPAEQSTSSFWDDKTQQYQKINLPTSVYPSSTNEKQSRQRANSFSPIRRTEFPYSSEEVKSFYRATSPAYVEQPIASSNPDIMPSPYKETSPFIVGGLATPFNRDKKSPFMRENSPFFAGNSVSPPIFSGNQTNQNENLPVRQSNSLYSYNYHEPSAFQGPNVYSTVETSISPFGATQTQEFQSKAAPTASERSTFYSSQVAQTFQRANKAAAVRRLASPHRLTETQEFEREPAPYSEGTSGSSYDAHETQAFQTENMSGVVRKLAFPYQPTKTKELQREHSPVSAEISTIPYGSHNAQTFERSAFPYRPTETQDFQIDFTPATERGSASLYGTHETEAFQRTNASAIIKSTTSPYRLTETPNFQRKTSPVSVGKFMPPNSTQKLQDFQEANMSSIIGGSTLPCTQEVPTDDLPHGVGGFPSSYRYPAMQANQRENSPPTLVTSLSAYSYLESQPSHIPNTSASIKKTISPYRSADIQNNQRETAPAADFSKSKPVYSAPRTQDNCRANMPAAFGRSASPFSLAKTQEFQTETSPDAEIASAHYYDTHKQHKFQNENLSDTGRRSPSPYRLSEAQEFQRENLKVPKSRILSPYSCEEMQTFQKATSSSTIETSGLPYRSNKTQAIQRENLSKTSKKFTSTKISKEKLLAGLEKSIAPLRLHKLQAFQRENLPGSIKDLAPSHSTNKMHLCQKPVCSIPTDDSKFLYSADKRLFSMRENKKTSAERFASPCWPGFSNNPNKIEGIPSVSEKSAFSSDNGRRPALSSQNSFTCPAESSFINIPGGVQTCQGEFLPHPFGRPDFSYSPNKKQQDQTATSPTFEGLEYSHGPCEMQPTKVMVTSCDVKNSEAIFAENKSLQRTINPNFAAKPVSSSSTIILENVTAQYALNSFSFEAMRTSPNADFQSLTKQPEHEETLPSLPPTTDEVLSTTAQSLTCNESSNSNKQSVTEPESFETSKESETKNSFSNQRTNSTTASQPAESTYSPDTASANNDRCTESITDSSKQVSSKALVNQKKSREPSITKASRRPVENSFLHDTVSDNRPRESMTDSSKQVSPKTLPIQSKSEESSIAKANELPVDDTSSQDIVNALDNRPTDSVADSLRQVSSKALPHQKKSRGSSILKVHRYASQKFPPGTMESVASISNAAEKQYSSGEVRSDSKMATTKVKNIASSNLFSNSDVMETVTKKKTPIKKVSFEGDIVEFSKKLGNSPNTGVGQPHREGSLADNGEFSVNAVSSKTNKASQGQLQQLSEQKETTQESSGRLSSLLENKSSNKLDSKTKQPSSANCIKSTESGGVEKQKTQQIPYFTSKAQVCQENEIDETPCYDITRKRLDTGDITFNLRRTIVSAWTHSPPVKSEDRSSVLPFMKENRFAYDIREFVLHVMSAAAPHAKLGFQENIIFARNPDNIRRLEIFLAIVLKPQSGSRNKVFATQRLCKDVDTLFICYKRRPQALKRVTKETVSEKILTQICQHDWTAVLALAIMGHQLAKLTAREDPKDFSPPQVEKFLMAFLMGIELALEDEGKLLNGALSCWTLFDEKFKDVLAASLENTYETYNFEELKRFI